MELNDLLFRYNDSECDFLMVKVKFQLIEMQNLKNNIAVLANISII